ncbi:MAG TPA: hypothetical protein VGA85_02560 [Dehalococcoidales bacterium]
MELLYQMDLSTIDKGKQEEIINDTIKVLTLRVQALGIKKPMIERLGESQIVIRFSGVTITDVQAERIGRTALLEFRELVQTKDAQGNVIEERWVPATGTYNGEIKVLNSSYLKRNTEIRVSSLGAIELYFEWDEEGAVLFKEITTRLLNKPLGLYEGSGDDALPLLGEDGEPIAPIVQAVLTTDCVITGLSRQEATELSKQLNAGRLPIQLKLIGVQSTTH